MDVRRYTPGCMGRRAIKLGKQGENNAVRLEFDCSAWLAEYPGAAVELNVITPDGTTYNAELDGENGVYAFTVTEMYTVYAGQGMLELVLRDVQTATILKSATGYTDTEYSPTAPQPELPSTPDTPAGVSGGYVRYDMEQNLSAEEKATARKNIGAGTGDGTGGGGSGEPGEDGGYYTPKVSSAGVLSWTASKTGMPSVSSVNIKGPQGETGQTGPQGKTGPTGPEGYSPTVKLTRQTDGVLITVTNKGGSQSEKVYDGTGGGEGGGSGKNGVTFTPSVSEAGVISWTNDGGLTNPDPVDIKGPQGDKPEKGTDYFTADDRAQIVQEVLDNMPDQEGAGVPNGGEAGQILIKQSDKDGDAAWKTPAASDFGALPSDGTAADSNKLGGKAPDYYLYHKVLITKGHIVNCGTDVIEGHGIATVLLLPNGVAMINYAIQITKAGTASGVYEWGINRDLLRSNNSSIPVIKPIEGGCCTYTQSGSHNENLEGYGGTHQVNPGSNFWRFARVYETSGRVGGWSTKDLGSGCHANGVCFGTYERT